MSEQDRIATPTHEIYHHWSHFNFSPNRWREAAERFLSLRSNIAAAEAEDEFVDHDALGYNFVECDICEHVSELQDYEEEFAKAFSPIWAERILELANGK